MSAEFCKIPSKVKDETVYINKDRIVSIVQKGTSQESLIILTDGVNFRVNIGADQFCELLRSSKD